ncbi:MAG: COX15/CtaA family protein [Gammaproteobacteria bacterium]|nr:COX15/CtaA family protein [Gammaproteobacteria bacterium]MBT8150221.1 COX15/CtaA family protein [Gammaproteobacteria bacterium]NND38855.1 COX15/CtaA family protein [Pseudomonadales bacterium]NNL11460.1 COX15/CtaA family protein [Pseudomonadales bacterium]RZV60221.1 MAG: heme A synthase [Pseudomonadales bacterium]
MSSVQRKPGFYFAAAATAFALCVVMLGAFTRLVDAGLGCPDWPVCYGHILWPSDAGEVAAANARFPDTPVEHDKTWPEQVHRLLAASLGLFCIALLAIALRQRHALHNHSYPLKLPLALLFIVIVQGLFGMWTVTLKLWPQVVTAHLLGGFTTFSLLALLSLRLANRPWRLDTQTLQAARKLRPLAVAAMLVLALQIGLGGWTTSNYAALACPDFPQCQTVWWPQMDFSRGFDFSQHIGPNYLGGVMHSAARTAIHVSHRLGALVVTVVLLLLLARLWRLGSAPPRRYATVLSGLLLLQLTLGISNVVFALPLYVAVAHNAVGALLAAALLGLCYRLFSAQAITGN